MSGVATLKPRKRAFDEMNIDLPVPHQACSPARFVIRPPPLKRGRCTPSASSASPSTFRVTTAVPTLPKQTPSQPQSPPSPSTVPTDSPPSSPQQRFSPGEIAALARHVPRRLKRVVDKMAAGSIGDKDKVFTVADLKEIISSVLAEREARLNEEFAKNLHERLAEQFRDFTKFNEDYVTRQLRGTDLAYLS